MSAPTLDRARPAGAAAGGRVRLDRLTATVGAIALAVAVLHLAYAPAHMPTLDPPVAFAHGDDPAEGTDPAAAAAPSHRDEPPALLGVLFLVGGLFGLAFSALVLAGYDGWVLWLVGGAGGHAVMVAAGIASRTVGLLGHRDSWWELAFLLALALEVIVVAGSVARSRRDGWVWT